MGVKGLNSFIRETCKVVSQHQLHDTKIVIDGLNFLYHLYFDYGLNIIYAGDYDELAQLIKDCFKCFKKCNIEPIFVMDGGTDPSDRKRNTLLSRFVDKLQSAWRISRKGETNVWLLPMLCYAVLIEVIEELNIPILQSEFEADEEIASIATHYKCPVVSNDSDFYLFDLPYGYVLLDSIDFSVMENNRLKCEIYFCDKLLKLYPGVKKEVLPLLGTILGNDFVDVKIFNNFFQNITTPRHVSRGRKVSIGHSKIIGLLNWLRDQTFGEAIDQVICSLKQSQRKPKMDLLLEYTAIYIVKPVSHFSSIEALTEVGDIVSSPIYVTKQNSKIPNWFYNNFRRVKLHSLLLDILTLNRIFLPPQISEASSRTTSHACSEKIRLVIYKLLLTIEGKSMVIEEYDRYLASVIRNKKNVELNTTDTSSVYSTPNIFEMPLVEMSVRMNYFLQSLESCNYPTTFFPEKLRFVFVVLNFYLQNSLIMDEDILNSWIISVIFQAIVIPLAKGKAALDICGKHFDIHSPLNIILHIDRTEAENAKKTLQEYFRKPYHSYAKPYRCDIIQRYSELQSCLYYSLCLNQLLCHALPSSTLTCFSGTFVYQLTVKLQSKPDSMLYISNLFGRTSKLNQLFVSVRQLCLSKLNTDIQPQKLNRGPSNSSKSQRRKTHKPTTTKRVSISNRFQNLSVNE